MYDLFYLLLLNGPLTDLSDRGLLSLPGFKLLHGIDKRMNAGDRKCIIERSTEPSYTAMTFDTDNIPLFCKFKERLFQLRILHHKADIHPGAVFHPACTFEKGIPVNFPIKGFRFGFIFFFN